MVCWVHLLKNEGGEEGERDRREGFVMDGVFQRAG